MSFRDEWARVIANDPRYSIEAYAFILEALNQARQSKLKSAPRDRAEGATSKAPRPAEPAPEASGKPRVSGHVNAGELCDAVRRLALRQYGLLGATVLAHWGVRSTSDIGDIVYNLIAAGDLEKTENDSRADFNGVFDFESVFKAHAHEATGNPASKPTGNPESAAD
jgi:uncharacterized repeat protein (TIGR04138 family)